MEYETQEELMRQEGELLESSPVSTGKKAKTFIAKKRVPISEVADGTVEKPEPDTSGEEVKANTTGPVGDVTQHTPGVYEDAATLVKSGGDAYIGGTVLPNSKVRAKLRPADQYSNDPFWLESRDRFVPTGDWTVNLSFLEKPAKITTSDINKGVYQIATEHLAAAPEDFFGYEYQPWAPEKETWVSAFTSEFEKATGDTMANTWNAINNFLDSDTIVSPEKRAELNRKTGGWIRRKGQQILDYYSELEPMERGRGAEIAGIAGSGTASMLPTFVAAPFVLAGGWAGALAAVGGRLGTAMMSAHEALGTQDAALKAGMTPKEAQRAGLKHFGAIATTETVLGGAADILGAGVMRAAITRGASRSLLFALGVGTGAASGVVSSVGEVYQDKAGLIASKQAGLEILGSWSRDDWNTFYGSLVTEALGIPGHMKGADTQIKKTEAEFNKYLAKGAMFKKILVDAAKAKGVELPQDVLDRIDQVIIDVWNNAERDLDADAKSIAQEIYDRTAEAIAEDPVVYEKAKALFEGGDAEALSKQAFTELDARMEKEVFTPDVTEEERKAYRAAVYATAMIGAYFFGSSPSNLRLPDIKNIKDSGGRFGPGTRAATEVAVGVNPETNQVEVPTFVVHSNRSGQNRDSDKGTYKKYRPSQRQNITDIMDFLHEMVHVQDWSIEFLSMLGDNPDNLNEFLDWFVGPVAEMYGKKRAKAVRSAAKKRVKEGKTVTGMFERAEYDSSDSSSEQRAHAIMFMANKALKHLGLEGNAANYVRAVNAMLMGMNEVTPMSSFVSEYLKDLKSYVDSNSKTIKKLRGSVSAQNMHAALKSYMGGNNNINWMGVNPSTIEEFAKAANKPLDKEALDYVIDSLGDIPIDDLINKVKRDYGTVFPEDSSQDVPTESERVQEKRMNEIETGEEESAIEDWDAPDTYTFASKGYANDENSEYTDVIFSAKSPEAESISDLVEEAKGQKKSEFWKKAHKQFNGRTLEQDMDAVAEAIKEHKFSNAGLTISLMRGTHAFLNALGGEKLDRMFDFVARYEDYTNNVMSSNRSLLQVLLPLFDGSLWKYENYVRDASVRKYTINYVDLSSGRTEQRTFSKRELLSAVLYDEQPDSHDRIRKTVDIDEIMQYLTEEDIAFAHALRDFLKDNYTKAKGEGAKKVPQNYWPIQDAYAQEKGNERIINDFGRKDTDAPIGLVDVMDVMGGYLSRVAGTQSGYFAAHRRLNSIINYNKKNQMDKAMTAEDMELNDRLDRKSTEIKKMIRERLGDARTKRLDGRIADVIKHRDEEDLRNAMLSQIARNITGTMLNGSAKQFSINSPNFLSYMGYEHTTIPKFVYGVAKAMVYFVRSYRLAMENESIKNRAEAYRFNEYMAKNLSANDDNMLTYLANYATRKDWNTGAAVADFMIHMGQLGKKMFASFTKYGDLVANIIGYAAVYESALEAFGGNVEMAKRDLARFMNERQSTANQAVKGLMVRETNRNAWYGSLFAFTGETTQKWGTIGQDINRMVSGDLSIAKGSRDITAQALPLIAYAAVASGLMLTVAMSLFGEKVSDDDWEKVYDNFFEQAFLQLAGMAGPWSNAVAEPALEQSVFGKKNSTLSIPFVSEIMKVTKDVGEGEYDDVLMHLISDFGVLNGAARGYTSIDGLVRMMSSNAKESRAGVWQASGRSEAYANYMAGIKKKKKSQKKSGGVSIK